MTVFCPIHGDKPDSHRCDAYRVVCEKSPMPSLLHRHAEGWLAALEEIAADAPPADEDPMTRNEDPGMTQFERNVLDTLRRILGPKESA